MVRLPDGKMIIKNSLYYSSNNMIHNIPLNGYVQRIYKTYNVPVQLTNTDSSVDISLLPNEYTTNQILYIEVIPTIHSEFTGVESGDAYYSDMSYQAGWNTDAKGYIYYHRNSNDNFTVNEDKELIHGYNIIGVPQLYESSLSIRISWQGMAFKTQNMYIKCITGLWLA